MIQLEQQQHGEFWVGWVGWWVGWVTYQLPISSSLCGWINKIESNQNQIVPVPATAQNKQSQY